MCRDPVTLVLWDVTDVPVPPGHDEMCAVKNIVAALGRYNNNHSMVSIFAYGGYGVSKKLADALTMDGIMCWGEEERQRRQSMVLLEILVIVYTMKIDPPAKIDLLFVLKDIPQCFAPVLKKMKLLYGNLQVHFVLPHGCVLERHVLYDTSKLVWDWETLLCGGSAMADSDFPPLGSSLGRRVASSKVMTTPPNIKESSSTSVFWNVDDFPIPDGHDLQSFCLIIQSALKYEGYPGDVSIKAYGAQDNLNLGGVIPFVPETDTYWRLHHMLFDIGLSMLENYKLYSEEKYLMLLAKNVPKGMDLVNLLECMTEYYSYNVLLVVSRDCNPGEGPLPKVNKVLFWESLIDGGKAISTSELDMLLAQCPRTQPNYLLR